MAITTCIRGSNEQTKMDKGFATSFIILFALITSKSMSHQESVPDCQHHISPPADWPRTRANK